MRSDQMSILGLLLLALVLGQGCSSSQTSGDGSVEAGGLESGADAVGSIPEDMLATEELPMSSDFIAGDPSAPEEADPFSDLLDDSSSNSADALGVPDTDVSEDGSGLSGTTDTYTVKAGDTLMKIAFTIYGDIDRWKDLQEWNRSNLKSANQLKVGMNLTYETPLNAFQADEKAHSYTIKQGDTLAGIADEVYGRKMKYKKLQKYNNRLIKNPNRIFAGFTIFYDITQQEMADAEARRAERMAGGESVPAPSSLIPSAIAPPAEAYDDPSQPIAVSPPVGPPAPGQ